MGVAEGKPMRADARRNYELLVEAARKVLTDQGVNASMEAIARQAGVGVGTLYRHFPKRIDVVEAVYRDDVDALVAAAEQAEVLEPWEALEAWLNAFVAYGKAKRVLLSELHEAFEKNPSLKSNSRDRIAQACQRVLDRAQEAGAARKDVTGADVVQLISPMCTSTTLEEGQVERMLAITLDGLRVRA
jgi:AcrR family transcriptional regulator